MIVGGGLVGCCSGEVAGLTVSISVETASPTCVVSAQRKPHSASYPRLLKPTRGANIL